MATAKIEITISSTGDMLPVIREYILTRPVSVLPEIRLGGDQLASWVLVHGQHDSGTIEGVFGPYTEEHADWLLGSMLNATYGNWTKARLSNGPELPEPQNT